MIQDTMDWVASNKTLAILSFFSVFGAVLLLVMSVLFNPSGVEVKTTQPTPIIVEQHTQTQNLQNLSLDNNQYNQVFNWGLILFIVTTMAIVIAFFIHFAPWVSF